MEQHDDSRIPLDHFADFRRCTLYSDPSDPSRGTTGSILYAAAMEAIEQHINEKIKMHARGEVHPDDREAVYDPEHFPNGMELISLKGREPGKFGNAVCSITSSRAPTGGAIGGYDFFNFNKALAKAIRAHDPLLPGVVTATAVREAYHG